MSSCLNVLLTASLLVSPKENEPTTTDSGTTVTIDFAHDTIDHDVTEYITRKLNPERTLCGWSKNEVFVTNAEYKEYNECRVPDAWYFNGHEYKKPCYYENYSNFKGILVGKVFYGLPSEHELAKDAKYQELTSLIIPFDINNTCASEIATLNQMLSDLDQLIK